jgi:DNA-binding MarR family transcriptional regulator
MQLSRDVAGCAAEVLETSLAVTRLARAGVRQRSPARLTLSQIRALAFIRSNPGSRLNDLADHLGLGAPTTSRLAAQLVGRRLLTRRPDPTDRRRSPLYLTPAGRRAVVLATAAGAALVAERLDGLKPAELTLIRRAMRILALRVDPAEPGASE